MTLRFARLGPDARAPVRAHPGDAGYDLFAAEDAEIGPGERASVGTGIAIAVPDGCAGLVLPRSAGLRPASGAAGSPIAVGHLWARTASRLDRLDRVAA